MDSGYVYLIKCKERYKIGYSTNPKKRKQRIEQVSPFRMELLATIPTENPADLEREYHLKFLEQKVKGEWFELTKEQVKKITNGSVSFGKTAYKSNTGLRKEQIKMKIEAELDKLETYRKAKNLSKQRMGDKLGVSGQTYENWRSRKTIPDLFSWYRIQHFLGGD